MQDIVTKINILLQEIHDMKLQNKRNNTFNAHKNYPKDIGEENALGDTHLFYNSASSRQPHDIPNILGHHDLDPNHVPNTDGNAFMQQKHAPYKLLSASPPELLSSSSSDKDLMDNNVDHARYALIKTGLPWKRGGRGEGELEMEGEQEMRGRREVGRPGPSSGTVTKLSGPELDSEAVHR